MILKLVKTLGDLLAKRHRVPYSYEGAHYFNVYVDGTFTSENAGKHGYALLCEHGRQVLRVFAAL